MNYIVRIVKTIRISVAVNGETRSIIEDLARRENKTISDIIRHAVLLYSKLKSKDLPIDLVEEYLSIIPSGDNIIVDLELWLTILDELNRCGSEEFWNTIEKIGYKHGLELRNKNNDVEQILRYLGLKHLFEFRRIENGYTLILSTRSETKVLKRYLKGLFESLGLNEDIIESLRKLIIVCKNEGLKSKK